MTDVPAPDGRGHGREIVYLVAATPRTGSSLLCAGLWASGMAGNPGEVFAPDFRDPWRRRWSLPDDVGFATYLERARREGTTANGVFGVKIQWMHVAHLLHEAGLEESPGRVLDRLFSGACFINTIRGDRRAQALSWYRAITTGQWHITSRDIPARAPAPPSLSQIRWLEDHIGWQQAEWERHITERGARCLRVRYEDLRADYGGQVARALAFLGVDPSAAGRLPEPRLRPQADHITEQWRRTLSSAQDAAPADRTERVRQGDKS